MIDPEKDKLIPVKTAYKHLQGAPSGDTLRRYGEMGRKSFVSGEVVRLEIIQVGPAYYTTAEAWREFTEKLNARE